MPIFFYRLPQDENGWEKWIQILNLDESYLVNFKRERIHICSDHFAKDSFTKPGKGGRLKKTAVPTKIDSRKHFQLLGDTKNVQKPLGDFEKSPSNTSRNLHKPPSPPQNTRKRKLSFSGFDESISQKKTSAMKEVYMDVDPPNLEINQETDEESLRRQSSCITSMGSGEKKRCTLNPMKTKYKINRGSKVEFLSREDFVSDEAFLKFRDFAEFHQKKDKAFKERINRRNKKVGTLEKLMKMLEKNNDQIAADMMKVKHFSC